MQKKPLVFCLTAVITLSQLTTYAAAASIGGATTTTALNLRSGAGTSHSVITVAEKDKPVIVHSDAGENWYRVTYRGEQGYMYGQYLAQRSAMDADFGHGRITGSEVRFRTGPSTDTGIISHFAKGETVNVSGVDGAWYKTRVGGDTGYVHSDYVDFSAEQVSAQIGKVIGSHVRFRAGAGTHTQILGEFAYGTQVAVLHREGDWYRIRYNGTVGYIHADYLRIDDGSTPTVGALALIETAKRYLGVPYVYGGSSPSTGFDCSGFVQYVFRQHGISLNRTAAQQHQYDGVAVSRANLLPGDLLFFSNSGGSVDHVGMYIGDNQMIHASSGAKKVIISNITSSYYVTNYVGAKRIL